MKTCTICKTEQPLTNFHKHSKRKDGLQSKCKDCSSSKSKARYKKDPRGHYLKTKVRSQRVRRELRDWLNEIKSAGCTECDEKEPCCIDFHHLDPDKKDEAISRMLASEKSQEFIQKEIDKCVRLCSNCHRKFHAGKLNLVTGEQ
jgi:hypothetical protein